MRTSAPGLDEHRGAGQHALNTSDCFRLRRVALRSRQGSWRRHYAFTLAIEGVTAAW